MKTIRKATLLSGPFKGQEVRVLKRALTGSYKVPVCWVRRDVTPTKKSSATDHCLWVAEANLEYLEDPTP